MEIKRIPFRKYMKFLTLLLTSMLIATASASVYYSLSLQSRVAVSTPKVKFKTADDFVGNLTDTWVRLYLKSYPNATLTYERAVNLTNTGSTSAEFRLTPSDPTGDPASNWDFINFTVLDNSIPGQVKGTLNYTVVSGNWQNSGQTGLMTIDAGKEWTIKVITKSPSTATPGKVCNIVISVDVTE